MKLVLCLTTLVALYCAVDSKFSPPKVQVYSHEPGLFGKDNMLICHVSDFHPPDISIKLMKNGVELPSQEQTDLTFKQNWHFHLTKSALFKPNDGDTYSCVVNHATKQKSFLWDPNI